MAQFIFVTVFNLAVAAGGLVGGPTVDAAGPALLPWTLLRLVVMAHAAAWQANAYGLRIGAKGA